MQYAEFSCIRLLKKALPLREELDISLSITPSHIIRVSPCQLPTLCDLNGPMSNTIHTISGGTILIQVNDGYDPVILSHQSKFLSITKSLAS